MALPADVVFTVTSAALCTALILFRCAYRVICRCHAHPTCHRHWRKDDTIMALALLPLIARSVTIMTSYNLSPSQSAAPVTLAEAEAVGLSVAQLTADRVLAKKLLIPGRICYAMFLWCLKLCVLTFYARFITSLDWGRKAVVILWWVLIATFVAVVVATVFECYPIHLAWELALASERPVCARALGNLLTMGILNILTDLILMALPFPMLRGVRIRKKDKLYLGILFSLGIVIVTITIIRLPLIFTNSLSQRSRSLWASVEVLCACIVANAAFFFTLSRDARRQQQEHHSHPRIAGPDRAINLRRLAPDTKNNEIHEVSSKPSSSWEEAVEEFEGDQSDEVRMIR